MRRNYQEKLFFTRRLLLVVALILLFIAGIVGTLYLFRLGPFSPTTNQTTNQGQSPIDYNPPTKEQVSTGETIKEQTTNGASGSDPSPAPTPPAAGSTKSSVGMEMTSTNIELGTVHLRTLIQAITSSGTCTLTATGPSGKTLTMTAGVQAGPSTSTCKGFDIPMSSLSTGKWTFSIQFENDTLKAAASTEKTL